MAKPDKVFGSRLPGGGLTFHEWHAFVNGFYCGLVNQQDHPYKKERHYWRVGYLVGTATRRRYDIDEDGDKQVSRNN